MSDIKIVDRDFRLCPTLTPTEVVVVNSRQSNRIADCSDKEIDDALLNAISMAYFQSGQALNAGIVNAEIKELIPDLRIYFSTVCIGEIALFFKQGIDGMHGEYFGLNCKTYRQWLRSGMGSTARLEALKKQRKFLEELNMPPEPTAEEKEALVLKGVLDSFAEFKKTRFVYDTGNITYNWLDSKKIIPFTTERKKDIIKKAEANIRSEMMGKIQVALSSIERNKIKAEMDGLSDKDIRIKSEAKRVALNLFFKELVETDTELSDYINENTNDQ